MNLTEAQTKSVTWQAISELPEADVSNQSTGKVSRRDFLKLGFVSLLSGVISACNEAIASETVNNSISDEVIVIESFENLRRTQVASVKWLPIVVDTYWPTFVEEGKNFQIDPALPVIIALVESGFFSQALSQQGAEGLMQVTPGTKALLINKLTARDEVIPTNPIDLNIKLGTFLLRLLTDKFTRQIKERIAEDRDLDPAELAEVLKKVIWAYHDSEQAVDKNYMSDGAKVLVNYVLGMWSEKDSEESKNFKNIWIKGKSGWIIDAANEQPGLVLFENKGTAVANNNPEPTAEKNKKKKKNKEKEEAPSENKPTDTLQPQPTETTSNSDVLLTNDSKLEFYDGALKVNSYESGVDILNNDIEYKFFLPLGRTDTVGVQWGYQGSGASNLVYLSGSDVIKYTIENTQITIIYNIKENSWRLSFMPPG